MSEADFQAWVERMAGRRPPIGARPGRELAAALLDTFARDAAPLALEASGMDRLAARFRQLAPLGAPEALSAARELARESMHAVARAGRPHLFLASFAHAAEALGAGWAAGAVEGLFGNSGALEMAFRHAVRAGADPEAVRELVAVTVERFVPLSG